MTFFIPLSRMGFSSHPTPGVRSRLAVDSTTERIQRPTGGFCFLSGRPSDGDGLPGRSHHNGEVFDYRGHDPHAGNVGDHTMRGCGDNIDNMVGGRIDR